MTISGKIFLRPIRLTVIVFRHMIERVASVYLVVKKMSTETCCVLIKILITLFVCSIVQCKILNPVILGKSLYNEII